MHLILYAKNVIMIDKYFTCANTEGIIYFKTLLLGGRLWKLRKKEHLDSLGSGKHC